MSGEWIIVKSYDYGETWEDLGSFYFSSKRFFNAPHYLGEDSYLNPIARLGVIRTDNYGYDWYHTEHGLEENHIYSLAVSPAGSVYVGTRLFWFAGFAYRYASDIQSWVHTGQEILNNEVWSLDFHNNHLIARTNYEIAISNSPTGNWQSISPEGVDCPFSESYYASYFSQNGILYVGNDVCGIHFKHLGDPEWNWSRSGLPWDFIDGISENQRGHIYASTWQHGPYISTDEGQNWTEHEDNIPIINNIEFGGADTLFAATRGGLFWSTDDGDSWDLMTNGWTYHVVYRNGILIAGFASM